MTLQESDDGQSFGRCAGSEQPDQLHHLCLLHAPISGIAVANIRIDEVVLEVLPYDVDDFRNWARLPLGSKLRR